MTDEMAGMNRRGPSPLQAKRDLDVRLMRQGLSSSAACRRVGVHRKTGQRWRLGRSLPPFSAWAGVFGDQAVAAAMIDRIVHQPVSSRSKEPATGSATVASTPCPASEPPPTNPTTNLKPQPHRALFARHNRAIFERRRQLVAAVELKSQVGPSFGDNRTEEAIGNAVDVWRAYEAGTFGSVRPWLGF